MHFAGVVTYSSEGLLEKNKDPISEDLLTLLRGSDEPSIRKLFDDEQDETLPLAPTPTPSPTPTPTPTP